MVQTKVFELCKLLEKGYKDFIKFSDVHVKITKSPVGLSAYESFESYIINGVLVPTRQVTKLAKLISAYNGYNNIIKMYSTDLSQGIINKFELEAATDHLGITEIIKQECYDLLCRVQNNK